MANSTEKKRPRRPSARRSIPAGKPREEPPSAEPLPAADAGAPAGPAPGARKPSRPRKRVSGRPGKRSRPASPGEPVPGVSEPVPVPRETTPEAPGNATASATAAEPASDPSQNERFNADPFDAERSEELEIDPMLDSRMAPFFDVLYRKYFQVRALGLEKIPSSGGVVLACNHAGPVPWDGVMLKTAMRIETCARQDPRWLVDGDVFRLPFVGAFLGRIGAVPATRERAEQALCKGDVLAVFPEDQGVDGGDGSGVDAGAHFGPTGYVELALRTRAPLLPVAMVSADDSYPLLDKVKELPAMLGLAISPLLQRFPWPDPFGLLPLPGRWRIVVGEPIDELEEHGPDEADDPSLVARIDEHVRYVVKELFYVARAALQGGLNPGRY